MKQNLLVIIISLMIGLSSYKGIGQEVATESYSLIMRADNDGTEETVKIPSYFKIDGSLGEIKMFFSEPITIYLEIEVIRELDDYFYIKGINSHAITMELLYDKKDFSLVITTEKSESVYILIK